jgi:hypothetical protein
MLSPFPFHSPVKPYYVNTWESAWVVVMSLYSGASLAIGWVCRINLILSKGALRQRQMDIPVAVVSRPRVC